MSAAGTIQLLLLLVSLIISVPMLGRYLAKVYGDPQHVGAPQPAPGDRVFAPVERAIYRICGVDPAREQRWSGYALSLLAFSVVGVVILYVQQRTQGALPINPTGVPAVNEQVSFNTAISFVTNTNWQAYGGESTMSHLTQMAGLTVQNFLSPAAGMAVVIAVVRGLTRHQRSTIGNFWVDMTRSVTRVLLPLSLVLAIVFLASGVIQNFHGFTEATTLEGVTQQIPGGPVASQEAIKMLGSNGGGFLNVNSAHPFENPNGWSNLVSMWAILSVAFAFPMAYGRMAKDRKQGTVLLGVMVLVWLSMTLFASVAETAGNPRLTPLGVDQGISAVQPGGFMEGKDVRFGPASCAQWAAATTGTSNGSVNCMHGSMTPAGGGLPMFQMMLGEVSPGGLGVGLMGMLINALLAVFIAGLMVGRTPEYLGKKIQAGEMKLVVLYILAMPVALLSFAAVAILLPTVQNVSILNPGSHGLSEVLYGYASTANNNGSAFGGLTANTPWMATSQGITMLMGRFCLIIPSLAIAGSLVRKPKLPVTAGTFPTGTPVFAGLVVGVVLIVAGLTFFPALALGPIAEALAR